ncbi:MAG: outer membrane protein assembly factor BamB family protein [Planctomycetota bacterium]|jgi:outer membrane protein assembly factor BamB
MKQKLASRVFLVAFAVAVSDRVVQSADLWTGWLGPDRNGWVAGLESPKVWPASLRNVWSTRVGTGYGSPLVVDSRIFQHARQGNHEVLWCLDRMDGTVLWRKQFAVPFKAAAGGEYHGNGPKSCPVYADGRLFTMSINGTLSAWDASSGKLLWHRNYDAEFGKSHPNWGASTSPIVDGSNVIAHFGTDEAGVLVALDVATGEEVWKHGNDGASYSSPLLAEIDGVRQVVEWNHRALVGVESRTGKFLWEFPFPHIGSDQNMPTPTLHNGRVLLGGENRGIHGIRPELNDGKWMVTDEWHQKELALDMSSAVINNGLLYGFSHYEKGRLFCLDPQSGNVLWTGPPRTGQNVMLLSAPGQIAALINSGELRILKASRQQYEPIASYPVAAGRTWAPPVLLTGGVLVKDHEHLTFWSLKSHEADE